MSDLLSCCVAARRIRQRMPCGSGDEGHRLNDLRNGTSPRAQAEHSRFWKRPILPAETSDGVMPIQAFDQELGLDAAAYAPRRTECTERRLSCSCSATLAIGTFGAGESDAQSRLERRHFRVRRGCFMVLFFALVRLDRVRLPQFAGRVSCFSCRADRCRPPPHRRAPFRSAAPRS